MRGSGTRRGPSDSAGRRGGAEQREGGQDTGRTPEKRPIGGWAEEGEEPLRLDF